MLIRQETPVDVETVDAIHRVAFQAPAAGADPVEVALLQALRADPGWVPALSLVAEGPGRAPVGHAVCPEGAVGAVTALGLGPVGVVPAHPGRGVGTALLHAVLAAADALGYPVVVLLGHLDYYPRFGFVPATDIGIIPPDPGWGPHFQARKLRAWTPRITGEFRYAAPFRDL